MENNEIKQVSIELYKALLDVKETMRVNETRLPKTRKYIQSVLDKHGKTIDEFYNEIKK